MDVGKPCGTALATSEEEEALEHLNEATQETANGTTATATPPPVVEAGGKMAPLVEKEVTEKEKDEESPPAASEAATVTAEQTVAPPTESSSNEQSGNTKEKEKIDEEKEAVKDGRSEEERIQELMSRSDTAVVFAEPVEDELSAGDLEEGDETDYMLKCPHCDKGFTRVYILREHIRQQHGDKVNKHTCPKCNASFVLKSQLEKHLAFHASNVQVCKVCHKTFANVYRLQRHMISHDESTDLRKFKCPECGKAFKFKHHLKEHIRIHSGEKPFECGNCGKRFSHSGSYSSHMTSKKCWVVNLKMRRGVPEKPRDQATEQMRPLVPKPGDGSLDLSSSAAYANSITEFSQQFIPYDPVTGGPISAQLLAMNGVRPPFLPYGPYSSTPIQGLRLPTAPVTSAYSPGLTVSTPSIPSHAPAAATSPSKATDVQTKELPSEEAQKTASSSVEASENNLSSAVAEKASTNGDESIKKVLEMVDRTVAEQRACQDQKRAISKLNPAVEEPDSLAAKAKEALQQHLHKLDPTRVFSNASSPVAGNRCRYCKNTFPSPIDLHQHERYLCKQNREIPSGSESAERRGTPDSRTNGTISPTSSLGTDRTGDDEIDMSADADDFDKDNRCRVRSMFTEEQLMILRAHYDQNPRPRKYELVRIGNDIGFPKRVVQVWFQNMRARDRKRGKDVPYFPSMARPKKEPDTDQNQNQWNPGSKSSAANNSPYIPIVPKPFASNASASQQQSPTMAAYYAAGQQAKSGSSKVTKDMQAPSYVNPQLPFSSSQDEPLDLSVSSSIKREPSHAHTPSPRPQLSEPAHSMEGEVLNLSVKSELRRKGGKDSRFETSAIFKYMQQEGMIINHHAAAEAIRRSLTPEVLRRSLTPEVFRRSFTPRRSMSPSIPLSNQAHQPRSTESSPAAHRNHQHHHPHHAHHTHHENSPIPSPISDTRETPAVHPAMEPLSVKVDMANGLANKLAMHTNGSLDSSFNSTTSAELNSSLNLSEASLEDYGRSKRARKKSWRQVFFVEAEEMQLDQLEDSMMLGEDGQHRKKRRSWKAHKLDTEEGMYACDQCDKIFSKQSSLARHKYEHSGARPYCCDVCSKAFKHKHHLTEHKRLHSGEKPFECKKCGKRFSHSGSYSQHMNHRYKYCKPLKGEEGEMDMEMEMESS